MKTYFHLVKYTLLSALIIPLILSISAVANARTYQVTGPVTAVTNTTVTVQKGKSPWIILKGTNAQLRDVKVGGKITVKYHIVADTVMMKAPAGR